MKRYNNEGVKSLHTPCKLPTFLFFNVFVLFLFFIILFMLKSSIFVSSLRRMEFQKASSFSLWSLAYLRCCCRCQCLWRGVFWGQQPFQPMAMENSFHSWKGHRCSCSLHILHNVFDRLLRVNMHLSHNGTFILAGELSRSATSGRISHCAPVSVA